MMIRPYEAGDADAVKGLIRDLQGYERGLEPSLAEPTERFADEYLTRLRADIQPDGILLVALENDIVCGYAAGTGEANSQEAQPYFYVMDLSVAASARGQGVGTALMHALEAFAREQAYTRLMVGVLVANARVHGLYQRLGFRDYVIELVKDL